MISPTSRLRDASLEKAVYARLGSPSPGWSTRGCDQPSLTVFELADGTYREIAHIAAAESWIATLPFPVRVAPADLVRGLRP